jgi:hypothetical protein
MRDIVKSSHKRLLLDCIRVMSCERGQSQDRGFMDFADLASLDACLRSGAIVRLTDCVLV